MNLLKKDLERNNERKVMFGICFIFIIAMLIGSAYTSPLYPTNYGYDSAIFMLIGKAMVNGKTVYVDMFDHKGPILYFIEALGYYLGGRTGIWILQCIFGLVTIFFTYATWKLIYNKQQGLRMNDWLVVLVSGYSIFFYTFASGNLSEEYSLPFIAGCIYGFVKYVIRIEKEIKHSWIYAVFYGASIAILVLIRMNNAVAVCAGVLVIAVYLIYKKEYKNLLYNILGGMLGCSLILVPVIIYFLSKNALDDMIYATFLYNFKYASEIGHQALTEDIVIYGMLYFPIVVSVCLMLSKLIQSHRRREKVAFIDVLIITMQCCSIISLLMMNVYGHYFTIYIPVYMLVLSRCFVFEKKKMLNLVVLSCTCLYTAIAFYFLGVSVYYNLISDTAREKASIIYSDTQRIPEEERDSIIGYDIYSAYYLQGDILPCYKYYTLQDWWSISNPDIKVEFLEWLKEENPLWLLVRPTIKDEDMIQILQTRYELKIMNDYLHYYRLVE